MADTRQKLVGEAALTAIASAIKSDIDNKADAQATTEALATKADTASVNEALTTKASETEVSDIRVGANGTTYPSAGDAVREQFDELNNIYGNLLIDDQLTFSQGTIRANIGTDLDSDTRIRTDFIVKPIYATCENGYLFRVYAYSLSDSSYVGVLQSNGTFAKSSSNIADLSRHIFSHDYKYRIILLKDDETASISPSDSDNFHLYVATDKTLTMSGKSADAKVTGDEISKNSIDITAIASQLKDNEIKLIDINGTSSLKARYAINSSGAETSSGTSFCSNDFIPLNDADGVASFLTLTDASVGYYHFVAFYDANHTFIERIGGSKDKEVIGDVVSGAKFYKVSLTYVGLGNVSSYSCYRTYRNPSSSSPLNKWYIFGDSISAGYFSVTDEEAQEKGYDITYRPAGLSGVGAVWDKTLGHTYWGYANKWMLNRNLQPKAYPAQGYLRIASNGKNGIMMVNETDVSDAGLITVAWGFNDWHYDQPRGNHDLIDSSVPYPTAGYDTTQLTTINHAIWYCLGELIRKAPNAKIVVQTPMNGWLYGGDWDSNWGIGYAMTNSGTLANIHDDVKFWADYYGLQVLDMTYNNSIVNRRNIKDVLLDGSHPSDVAHQQLGRHVAFALGYC